MDVSFAKLSGGFLLPYFLTSKMDDYTGISRFDSSGDPYLIFPL
jgi:hypothetical protein